VWDLFFDFILSTVLQKPKGDNFFTNRRHFGAFLFGEKRFLGIHNLNMKIFNISILHI